MKTTINSDYVLVETDDIDLSVLKLAIKEKQLVEFNKLKANCLIEHSSKKL